MDTKQLLSYADRLFGAALEKTRDPDQAAELVQDTYLQVLVSINKGTKIKDPQAYLFSVLRNRFYQRLRDKYQAVSISYDQLPTELEDGRDDYQHLIQAEEAAMIRRELAFLSKTYREVMVRYYVREQTVAQIAAELAIPRGTVLSRLHAGRQKMKEGVEHMESYTKNSYQPEILSLGIDGRTGLNNEPFSCITGSLEQNILILAYGQPVSTKELSEGLGVPMAFLEERVEHLLREELLGKEGTRVFTDFPITTAEDALRNLEISKQFAADSFALADEAFSRMVEWYRELEGFADFEETYLYILAALSCRQNYLGRITDRLCVNSLSFEEYPDRPNYGKWIAIGSRYPHGFSFDGELSKYNVSGRSGTGPLSDRILNAVEWDIPVGHTHMAEFSVSLKQSERVLAIDAVKTNTVSPFQAQLLPDLERQGFIRNMGQGRVPAVPYITQEEQRRFFEIESSGADIWCRALLDKAVEAARAHSYTFPKRIRYIPEWLSADALFYLPMAYIYEAERRGRITLEKNKAYPILYIVEK